jgi:hypothetical protein
MIEQNIQIQDSLEDTILIIARPYNCPIVKIESVWVKN